MQGRYDFSILMYEYSLKLTYLSLFMGMMTALAIYQLFIDNIGFCICHSKSNMEDFRSLTILLHAINPFVVNNIFSEDSIVDIIVFYVLHKHIYDEAAYRTDSCLFIYLFSLYWDITDITLQKIMQFRL